MKLIEAEAKQLMKESGIAVPDFVVVKPGDALPSALRFPVMLKAQTLMGGRGKAGLVKAAGTAEEANHQLAELWKKNTETRAFESVLIEPQLNILRELYVAITYDTQFRAPVLVFSKFGGMDIEVVSKRQPQSILKLPIDPVQGIASLSLDAVFAQGAIKSGLQESFRAVVAQMYACFLKNDAELVEINPLIETMVGDIATFIAADGKISVDDTALFRHEFPFPRRTGFRELTEMEKQARAIDAESHRGVAGRTMLELDGDIAFMSSGGGASITCLDALIAYGGKPANFVEYSGNPERDKVYKLTKLVLSKPGLRALWLVGPTANFTDVYETLGGVMDAIREVKPTYPIVFRRAGPRDAEAKTMVEATAKELGLDLTFFGEEMAMTESAKFLMDKLSQTKPISTE